MTFTLYSVTADDFYHLEYEINGLVGCLDDTDLRNLLNKIINTYSLIYSGLCSLEDAVTSNNVDTIYRGTCIITPLFSSTYANECELKTRIASDLQNALPEHFI